MNFINRVKNKIFDITLDAYYLKKDKKHLKRSKNLLMVPTSGKRVGGKYSYGEWCHVIGLFQGLMYHHLNPEIENKILDIGCGSGLLGISAQPFLGDKGNYTGIEIQKHLVDFCNDHYPDNYKFLLQKTKNEIYGAKDDYEPWSVEDASKDAVTALSVWTHLNEEAGKFYLKEVARVLKKDGIAIITCFSLDKNYDSFLHESTDKGAYHMTEKSRWNFSESAYGSKNWFYPKWAEIPEAAIGVKEAGIDEMITESGLKLVKKYNGYWKEKPGFYFQDVLILKK